jgi:nucleoside phosphorylase
VSCEEKYMLETPQKLRILMLTALPQEYSPLKKLFPSWRLVRKRPSKKFSLKLPGKEIILIECGMGAKSAQEALGAELAGSSPDLLIFFGFAGGLHPDLPIGVVCFAVSVRAIFLEEVFQFRVPDALSDFLAQNHIRPVLALSAETPGDKQALSALASGQMAVLDMETATVAEIAWHNKIPFICLRAVSDPIGHHLGFNLSDISDERGRIRLTGVLFTVMRKPATLRAFYLSWRNSRLAARNLCGSVAAFLGISAPLLAKIAGEIKIERQ